MTAIRDASNQDLLGIYFEQAKNGDRSEQVEVEIIRRMGTRAERGDAIDSRDMAVDEGVKMIGSEPPPEGMAINVNGNIGQTPDGENLLVTLNLAVSMKTAWLVSLDADGTDAMRTEIAAMCIELFDHLVADHAPVLNMMRNARKDGH